MSNTNEAGVITGTGGQRYRPADAAAEILEAARLAQILNQFSNFFFCFVAARNVK